VGEIAITESDTPSTLQKRPPTHTSKYARLSQDEIAILHTMLKAGKTQVEIAQTLGCTQGAVSRWAASFTDTADLAKSYLRGKALSMAQNIVKKGRAADHIKALEGIEVLSNQDVKGGLTIVVGGSAQVQVNVGTAPQAVVVGPDLP
jgi:predicted transcriptional regulator